MDFLTLHGLSNQNVIENVGTSKNTAWSSETTHDVIDGVDKNTNIVFSGVLEDRFFGKGVMKYDKDTERLTVGEEKLLIGGYPISIPAVDETLQEGETVYLDIQSTPNDTFGSTASSTTKKHKSLYTVDEDINDVKVLELEDVQKGYSCKLNIKGNTLINLFSGVGEFDAEEKEGLSKGIVKKITNTEVTLFNYSDMSVSYLTSPIGEEYTSRTITVLPGSELTETITSGEYLWEVRGFSTQGWTEKDLDKFNESVLAIEGNIKGKGIRYFEGVKSVGYINDETMPSVNLINFRKQEDNLITEDVMYSPGKINCITGEMEDVIGMKCSNQYIEVEGGEKYTFVNVYRQLAVYDENEDIIDFPEYRYTSHSILGVQYNDIFSCTLPKKAKYVRVNVPQCEDLCYQMYKGDLINYITVPHIMRKATNEVMDEVVGDEFVCRCGEITVDESNIDTLDYGFEGEEHSEGYYLIHIKGVELNCSPEGVSEATCDRFEYVEDVWSKEEEGVYILDGETIAIKLGIDRFGDEEPSIDQVTKISDYFKENPFTIVYPIADEERVKLEDIELEMFDGQNNIVCSYDTVYPGSVTFSRYERRHSLVLEGGHTYVPVARVERGVFTDLRVYNPDHINYVSEDKDMEGVFTTVKMYRQNGILNSVSKLSNPDRKGNYTVMTVDYYDNMGSEIFRTERYKLTYDQDRDLVSQELI